MVPFPLTEIMESAHVKLILTDVDSPWVSMRVADPADGRNDRWLRYSVQVKSGLCTAI
jgi:hypothetical protein